MTNRTITILSLVSASLALVFSFQNCGTGFQVDTNKFTQSGSTSSGTPPVTPVAGDSPAPSIVDASALGIRFYDANQILQSSGSALTAGNDYTLFASGYSATQTLTWSLAMNTAGCALLTQATPFTVTLRCSTTGTVSAQLAARDISGVVKTTVNQHAMGPSVPDYCSAIVGAKPAAVFRIANGTGTGAWNAANSPIAVAVGQTLRICNDDVVNHQLKTLGSPCASQPAAMARGQFFDCLVSSTTTTGMSDALSNGSFNVVALDGRALYNSSCLGCHGTFPGQGGLNATGASGSTIDALIKANRGGMGSIKLTPEQLNAIGYALSF